MKKIEMLSVSLFILLFMNGCSQTNNHKMYTQNRIAKMDHILSDTMQKIIKDYVSFMGEDTTIIYQAFLEQTLDSSIFHLTYITEKPYLIRNSPDGFIKIGKNLVLIYSGMSYFLQNDEEYDNALKKELIKVKTWKEKEPYSPPLIHGLSWKICYNNQQKSYTISKSSEDKYRISNGLNHY